MNRLREENSPYLLQHANNPVDWYPWGEEALERAVAEEKPIFLSIGYAACHWCHVMAHESFEDIETAAIMNEHFINIKVDREERPEIDNIYMASVVAMIGQGGWPLNVFLTPSGKPFYGGTYFPPSPRYNMPSFKELLLSIARIWKDDRQKVVDSAEKITEYIRDVKRVGDTAPQLDRSILDRASLALAQSYDWDHGGWGRAPKFPQPMALEYLLRRASLGDKFSLEICTNSLDAMIKGGMYDVVGGGFSRYSTDDEWKIPHFEKMLYDNAQLSQVYLHAYLLTGNVRYRKVCEHTYDFILRELRNPQGGFYSSLDADSEGEEGKYYTWTKEEIEKVLDDDADIEFITEVYGITERGNFEGKNILQRQYDDQTLADRFSLSVEFIEERLESLHTKLLTARSKRIRPSTDDKVLTSWNALMMISFAEAARYLDRSDYLEVARQNAKFLLENMFQDEILLRSWRKGKSGHLAYLDDHAALILSLLSLYQSDPDPHWFSMANQLLNEMQDHFRHPDGGFYDTRDDHERLILRPRDLQDNAVPSGNALASLALLLMCAYTARGDLRDQAEKMLQSMQMDVAKYPLGFSKWLTALDLAINPVKEVAILGDPTDEGAIALVKALWSTYRPHVILAQGGFQPEEGSPPLLLDRPLKDSKATAYVCQKFTCHRPVNTPEDLIIQLEMPFSYQ